MIAPRIEIDLGAIEHNTQTLVTRLGRRSIAVTGVTKATLGSPDVAKAMVRGGARRIGDSRIENLEALAEAGLKVPLMLIRSPAPDQADRAVACARASFVSEFAVAEALSAAAGRVGTTHGIVLMIELGDLREGVMPADVLDVARRISRTRHLELVGLGSNLGCRSGVIPGAAQMGELSSITKLLQGRLPTPLAYISGGDSANLGWALGSSPVGSITDLRLGEAILLGVDPVTGAAIDGLNTAAFTVVGCVIESKTKPRSPWGERAKPTVGSPSPADEPGSRVQTIVALGEQDVDARGLVPPVGVEVVAARGDYLILETPAVLAPGTEVRFGVNYSALLRAMTSPFVSERLVTS